MRIRGWLTTPEMLGLVNFSKHEGAAALAQLKYDNTAHYPDLASELTGIASGARVPVDSIWVAALINELESLRSYPLPVGHCSDVYALPGNDAGSVAKEAISARPWGTIAGSAFAGGAVPRATAPAAGFYHGHNEDWPGPIREYWYLVAYNALPGADFSDCAGVVYPGGLVGWAASWNAKGLYLTQNSLFPTKNRPGGLSSGFAQRASLCGAGKQQPAASLDGLAAALRATATRVGWSSAASINMVSLHEARMANMEIHLAKTAMHEVAAATSSSSPNAGSPSATSSESKPLLLFRAGLQVLLLFWVPGSTAALEDKPGGLRQGAASLFRVSRSFV